MIHEQLNFFNGGTDGDRRKDLHEGILFDRISRAIMAGSRSSSDRGEVDQRAADEDSRSGNAAPGAEASRRPLKILYFDTETTGIDPNRNGLTQIAGIIEINGRAVESFDIRVQPFEFDAVDAEALRIQGRTFEEIMQHDAPAVAKARLSSILSKYVDKFDKVDKYAVAGQNVGFDMNFLSAFFKKCGDNFLGSYLNWQQLDLLRIVDLLTITTGLSLPNRKLATLAKHFGVDLLDAHDAMSDITATREIINLLLWGKK